MHKDAKIYIAGHRGLVGSAIYRLLKRKGFSNLYTQTSDQLDLCEQGDVRKFFIKQQPEYVFLAAAMVGGILANKEKPADFIYKNIMIQANVIEFARQSGVKKLLFLGSTCIYPRMSPQPIKEEYLLTGPLEKTNEWYAVAKIAGIKMCQAYRQQHGCNYISVMPTNLYGPGDNFDPESSHVLPALIVKFHEAKMLKKEYVTIWGSGKPLREFLHVDDCAAACIFLMENYDKQEIINVGVGEDISILDLAEMVKKIVGFRGDILFDTSKPDGTPRKLVDVSRINAMGWYARVILEDGIKAVYEWYQENKT